MYILDTTSTLYFDNIDKLAGRSIYIRKVSFSLVMNYLLASLNYMNGNVENRTKFYVLCTNMVKEYLHRHIS